MKLKMILIARNIINQDAIKDFITKVSENQDDKIKSWCNTILKNYLKNEYPNLKNVIKIKKNDPEWLKIAVQNKDAQEIIITDEFKRNLLEHVFPYFRTLTGNIKHSFTEAERKTKEWDERKSKFNIKLTKGVKELLKCNDGYTWLEIIDEETLYNEGEVIQNCLREDQHGPEYWKKIGDKKIKIFTLRDSKGIGHVGVEYLINQNCIEQMKGKQNDPPIKIYHPFCIELIKYLKCKNIGSINRLLGIISINNKIYIIDELPDNLVSNNDLYLEYFKVSKLPDNLTVNGKMSLRDSGLTILPSNLKVTKDLNISNTTIKELPDNLIVGGDLFVNHLLEKLGDNLQVVGNLYLSNADNLIELPDNLQIGGNLTLSDLEIKKLPNNMVVGGYLNMEYTKITELPDDLHVGKVIFISKNMKVSCENKELLRKIKIK